EREKRRGGKEEKKEEERKKRNGRKKEGKEEEAWRGGGEKAGAGKSRKDTASFPKEHGKVSDVLANYGAFVTADAPTGVSN
ncbi:taurine ABC transporter substrate-binding protein, partial [Rhizobium ruizarguesonis]